ncbi:uncharacterized protein LOC144442437 [Glandiceps talaboti]
MNADEDIPKRHASTVVLSKNVAIVFGFVLVLLLVTVTALIVAVVGILDRVEQIEAHFKDQSLRVNGDDSRGLASRSLPETIDGARLQRFSRNTPECPAGPPGPKGKRGKRGKKGPQGAPGQQGIMGEPGSNGLKGHTGHQGPPGQQGITGEPGSNGLKGDTGHQGPPGQQGITGEPGSNGLKGDTGPQGPPGQQGITGEPGSYGLKGDTGAQGPKGQTGQQGVQGEQGSHGLKGDIGPVRDDPFYEYLSWLHHEEQIHPDLVHRRMTRPTVHLQAENIDTYVVKDTTMKFWQMTSWSTADAFKYDERTGHVTVLIPGRYYIYSQVYYAEEHLETVGHIVCQNNHPLMRSLTSLNDGAISRTLYTGGVFNLQANDKISIKVPGTEVKVTLFVEKEGTFFGLMFIDGQPVPKDFLDMFYQQRTNLSSDERFNRTEVMESTETEVSLLRRILNWLTG